MPPLQSLLSSFSSFSFSPFLRANRDIPAAGVISTFSFEGREALWDHFHRIRMPSSLLNIKDLYTEDAFILVDGPKRVLALPTRGVKQRYPLSALLFSLCMILNPLRRV